MSKLCAPKYCLWGGCNKFCELLTKFSVPIDNKWPLVILQLRNVKDNVCLSEPQKASLQEVLISLFSNKDFSDESYIKTIFKINEIILEPLDSKLKQVVLEVDSLTEEVHELMGKQKEHVIKASKIVDDNIEKGEDPLAIINNLRHTLKDVINKMEEDANELLNLSYQDSLTGLANRRSFDDFLDKICSDWINNQTKTTLLLIDIDHFKKFNDTYGHQVGDQVLKSLGAQLKKVALKNESRECTVLAARYGGEEFALVFKGCTTNITKIAEELRTTMEKLELRLRNSNGEIIAEGISITISIGISKMLAEWGHTLKSNLIESADKALYTAKNKGRNCTVIHTPNKSHIYSKVHKS